MHVLVVEDDPGFRRALERFLLQAGHTMCWSGSGHGALKQLYLEKIDVVLLDLNLGSEMSGWDVARVKYCDPDLRDIPLVIISGTPVEQVREIAKVDILANAFVMSKPISMHEMLDLLKGFES